MKSEFCSSQHVTRLLLNLKMAGSGIRLNISSFAAFYFYYQSLKINFFICCYCTSFISVLLVFEVILIFLLYNVFCYFRTDILKLSEFC